MEGLNLPAWREVLAANPRNKERFLATEPGVVQAIMLRWLNVQPPPADHPGRGGQGVEEDRCPT